MEQMRGLGTRVRDITCILIASEEGIFSAHEGSTAVGDPPVHGACRYPDQQIEAIAVTDSKADHHG